MDLTDKELVKLSRLIIPEGLESEFSNIQLEKLKTALKTCYKAFKGNEQLSPHAFVIIEQLSTQKSVYDYVFDTRYPLNSNNQKQAFIDDTAAYFNNTQIIIDETIKNLSINSDGTILIRRLPISSTTRQKLTTRLLWQSRLYQYDALNVMGKNKTRETLKTKLLNLNLPSTDTFIDRMVNYLQNHTRIIWSFEASRINQMPLFEQANGHMLNVFRNNTNEYITNRKNFESSAEACLTTDVRGENLKPRYATFFTLGIPEPVTNYGHSFILLHKVGLYNATFTAGDSLNRYNRNMKDQLATFNNLDLLLSQADLSLLSHIAKRIETGIFQNGYSQQTNYMEAQIPGFSFIDSHLVEHVHFESEINLTTEIKDVLNTRGISYTIGTNPFPKWHQEILEAAKKGNKNKLMTFKKHPVLFDFTNEKGQTAFTLLILNKHPELAMEFLGCGNISSQDMNGYMAHHHAIKLGYDELAYRICCVLNYQQLMTPMTDGKNVIDLLVENKKFDLLMRIVQAQPQLEHRNASMALLRNDRDFFQRLIQRGLKPNVFELWSAKLIDCLKKDDVALDAYIKNKLNENQIIEGVLDTLSPTKHSIFVHPEFKGSFEVLGKLDEDKAEFLLKSGLIGTFSARSEAMLDASIDDLQWLIDPEHREVFCKSPKKYLKLISLDSNLIKHIGIKKLDESELSKDDFYLLLMRCYGLSLFATLSGSSGNKNIVISSDKIELLKNPPFMALIKNHRLPLEMITNSSVLTLSWLLLPEVMDKFIAARYSESVFRTIDAKYISNVLEFVLTQFNQWIEYAEKNNSSWFMLLHHRQRIFDDALNFKSNVSELLRTFKITRDSNEIYTAIKYYLLPDITAALDQSWLELRYKNMLKIVISKLTSSLTFSYSERLLFLKINNEKRYHFGQLEEDVTKLVDNLPHQSGIDINRISHKARASLKDSLYQNFNRRHTRVHPDAHGVYDYTLSRTVLDLLDDETIKQNGFEILGLHLKQQAKSFKTYFLSELAKPEALNTLHLNKSLRAWERMFAKHFTIGISEISIVADDKGHLDSSLTRPLNTDCKPIKLVTQIGFDVSAHRLSGVHFGDFQRYIIRKDGKDPKKTFIKGCLLPYPENTELWKDAYKGWLAMNMKPKTKYRLNTKLLKSDYKIQLGLLFKALQREGIEVPNLAAIGCGVFGRSFFPDYQQVLAQAYAEVLSENDYGFKAVILCELNKKNIDEFRNVMALFRDKLKTPFYIVKNDILVTARQLSSRYSTTVHNAGDLWEFGQFWEQSGSLEEYCAAMTTGYYTQHPQMNPLVLESSHYVSLTMNDLGLKLEPDEKTSLVNFIHHLNQLMAKKYPPKLNPNSPDNPIDLTVLNYFKDAILKDKTLAPKASSSALKAIEIFKFLKSNELFIRFAISHRLTKDKDIQRHIYKFVDSTKHGRNDIDRGVIRDFNDTSFHLNAYKADNVDFAWEDISAYVKHFEDAIMAMDKLNLLREWVITFEYNDSTGCIEQRMNEPWKYAMLKVSEHDQDVFNFDNHMHQIQPLFKGKDSDYTNYCIAFAHFETKIGKKCLVHDKVQEINWQLITDYMRDVLGFDDISLDDKTLPHMIAQGKEFLNADIKQTVKEDSEQEIEQCIKSIKEKLNAYLNYLNLRGTHIAIESKKQTVVALLDILNQENPPSLRMETFKEAFSNQRDLLSAQRSYRVTVSLKKACYSTMQLVSLGLFHPSPDAKGKVLVDAIDNIQNERDSMHLALD